MSSGQTKPCLRVWVHRTGWSPMRLRSPSSSCVRANLVCAACPT